MIGSLRKKIEELDFLNELQLELKGLTTSETILEKAVFRLQAELEADCGWHCQAHGHRMRSRLPANFSDREEEINGIVEQLDLQQMTQPTAGRIPDGRSLCILPLMFQGTSFGFLVFLLLIKKIFTNII